MILAHSLCLAVLLVGPPPIPNLDRQKVIDQLAPYMASFRDPKEDGLKKRDRFCELLGKLGIESKYDPVKQDFIPGFSVEYSAIQPIQGMPQGTILFLQQVTATKNDTHISEFYVLYYEKDGKVAGEVLASSSDAYEMVMPQTVIAWKGKLIISGLYGWFGNWPRRAVRSYEPTSKGWRLYGKLTADEESFDSSSLKVMPDGNEIAPITFMTRKSPKHLLVGHVTSNLTFDEKWTFENGAPKRQFIRECDTPYNVLDRLYAAIEKKDLKFIRSKSASDAIYRRLLKLHARTDNGGPWVVYPTNICDPFGTVIGVENLRTMFHFKRKEGHWVVGSMSPIKKRVK